MRPEIYGLACWFLCVSAAMGQELCPPSGCQTGGWHAVEPPAACLVPVFVGNDPRPTAGIYVGEIRGRGVTLTCRHALGQGVRRVGQVPAGRIYQDKLGHDLAAVLTAPLRATKAVIGRAATIGQRVRISGYGRGRACAWLARALGYHRAEKPRRYGSLILDQPCQDGDSGGAVIAADGRVVGMIWGTATDGSSYSVAVPAPAIADFLKRLETTLAKQDADAQPLVPEEPDEELPDVDTNEIGRLEALIEANAAAIAMILERPQLPGPQGEQGPPGSIVDLKPLRDAVALVCKDQAAQKEALDALDVKVGDIELASHQAKGIASQAKSQSDAVKQTADDLDRQVKTLRLRIQRIETSSTTATGTDASGKMHFRLHFDGAGNVARIEPLE